MSTCTISFPWKVLFRRWRLLADVRLHSFLLKPTQKHQNSLSMTQRPVADDQNETNELWMFLRSCVQRGLLRHCRLWWRRCRAPGAAPPRPSAAACQSGPSAGAAEVERKGKKKHHKVSTVTAVVRSSSKLNGSVWLRAHLDAVGFKHHLDVLREEKQHQQ